MMILNVIKRKAPIIGAFFIVFQLNAQSLKDQLSKEKIILCAHRGGMYAGYAENSLKTLEYLEKSFEGTPVMAEVDVRKSKRRYFVLVA
ncbi:MAG: hypothetical protein WDO15_15510 [Bacteroidota bacterium]